MLLAFAAGLLSITACRDLDPAGAYKGDKVLYNADQTITTAYDLMHTFVLWEYQNRAALPIEVTKAADAVRANAQNALKTATAARQSYAANPSDGTALSNLNTALEVLRSLLTQIQQYVPATPATK